MVATLKDDYICQAIACGSRAVGRVVVNLTPFLSPPRLEVVTQARTPHDVHIKQTVVHKALDGVDSRIEVARDVPLSPQRRIVLSPIGTLLSAGHVSKPPAHPPVRKLCPPCILTRAHHVSQLRSTSASCLDLVIYNIPVLGYNDGLTIEARQLDRMI
jgi:hypothetical protein